MTPSWYDVLDVESTASAAEIRAAWRSQIADLEPGSRRFQTLNQAAEVLLDAQTRAAYDAELAAQAPAPVAVSEPSGVDLTQPVDAPAGATPTGAARTVPTWLLALLGVVAAGCLTAALWVWQTGDDTAVEDATSSAQSAAEQAIVPVLSYDYENLDADQKRAQSYLTADYREDYDQLFGVIADNAPSTQTKVAAEVIASGIVRSGEDRVDVLVFVDRPTTNKLTPEPVTYKDQVTVTMQKVGDDWLIDNLVTSPAAQ
ncbi:DnaJ domain-containing protein [Nocardioides sp.]|uniref:DnaJ domain-containing protein n=1 Tax=Nocardioides sp. TaxID=35761 RepID=UPI00286D92B6|nr:DnaJ domain-containing protein [Nocardioides sp.]